MVPSLARKFTDHIAAMPSKAPPGSPVAFECMCGWETPYGKRVDALRAVRRHLIRCH